MLLFQDKDYREERKKVQTIIHQQQTEQFQNQQMFIGRQKRAAAQLNYTFNESMMNFDNQQLKKTKTADQEEAKVMAKKFKTIKIPKLFEF